MSNAKNERNRIMTRNNESLIKLPKGEWLNRYRTFDEVLDAATEDHFLFYKLAPVLDQKGWRITEWDAKEKIAKRLTRDFFDPVAGNRPSYRELYIVPEGRLEFDDERRQFIDDLNVGDGKSYERRVQIYLTNAQVERIIPSSFSKMGCIIDYQVPLKATQHGKSDLFGHIEFLIFKEEDGKYIFRVGELNGPSNSKGVLSAFIKGQTYLAQIKGRVSDLYGQYKDRIKKMAGIDSLDPANIEIEACPIVFEGNDSTGWRELKELRKEGEESKLVETRKVLCEKETTVFVIKDMRKEARLPFDGNRYELSHVARFKKDGSIEWE